MDGQQVNRVAPKRSASLETEGRLPDLQPQLRQPRLDDVDLQLEVLDQLVQVDPRLGSVSQLGILRRRPGMTTGDSRPR